MRMPNGYGSVYKLKDRKYTGKDGKVHTSRRRNPWVARVTTGYKIVGRKAYPVYYFVGYYPTRVDAMTALEDYKRSGVALLDKMTFSDAYERWSEKKFQDLKVTESYRYAFRSCSHLHRIQISNLTVPELQDAIDRLGSYSSMNNLKLLFVQLFEFAYIQGAVSVDMKERVKYLDIEHGAKIQRRPHVPFTGDEIRILIEQDSPLVLILVLSGVPSMSSFSSGWKMCTLKSAGFLWRTLKQSPGSGRCLSMRGLFPALSGWPAGNTWLNPTILTGTLWIPSGGRK